MRHSGGFSSDERPKNFKFRMEEAKIPDTGEPVTASFQPILKTH